jgi:DNA primase catalytic subunit
MVEWLSYGNGRHLSFINPSKFTNVISEDKDYFLRREFSFTIKDDVYIRYKSYPDANSLLKDLEKNNPHKIDIGAVYTVPVILFSSWKD